MNATVASTPASSKILLLEPIWLLTIGPVILFPGRLVAVDLYPFCVAALFLFWPLRWFVWQTSQASERTGFTGRYLFPPQSPLSISLLALLLWLPVNYWASAEPNVSWVAIGYLLYGALLCVGMINWQPARRFPEIVALTLVGIGAALALIAPLLVQLKPEFRLFYLPIYASIQRLSASRIETIHANVLAGAMVLYLPLFFSVAIAPTAYRNGSGGQCRKLLPFVLRLLSLIGALAAAIIIVLTQSRGAYLASGVALAAVLLLRWPKLLWALIPTALLGLFFAGSADFYVVLDAMSVDGSLGGWEGRVDIWRNSLHAIADFAFTGIGIGTFTTVLPRLYPLRYSVEGFPHAHHHLLQIGIDLGLPGLIAYIAVLIAVSAMMVVLYSKRASLSRLYNALVLGSIAAFVGILVHGQLDAVLWGTKLAFLPWLLFSLVATLFRALAISHNATRGRMSGSHKDCAP